MADNLETASPWRALGQPVEVRFPLANTAYEVLHLLGAVPDGMIIVTADANITRQPGKQWTDRLAYLQSGTANSYAVLVFGVLTERSTYVSP